MKKRDTKETQSVIHGNTGSPPEFYLRRTHAAFKLRLLQAGGLWYEAWFDRDDAKRLARWLDKESKIAEQLASK